MMMNKITEMVEKMHEEAEEAQEYALLAEQHKADDRELSEMYAAIAANKLDIVTRMHDRMIRKVNEMGADMPPELRQVMDWVNKKTSERTARVKNILEMAKRA